MNGKTNILIVEDDPSLLNLYSQELIHAGFKVTIASSARDGLDKVKKQTFDLIILDMLMPEMSGLDFLEAVNPKETMPKTKILVLSNTESSKIIDDAIKMGATQYFLKAESDPSELVTKTMNYLKLNSVDFEA